MAQKTWTTGDVLTASDLNTYASREGGAWTTYTPTLTQSGTVTNTVTRAVYARAGRLIHFDVELAVTGSGTTSNPITVTLPVAAAKSSGLIAGNGSVVDSSASQWYGVAGGGQLYLGSTTTVKIADNNVTTDTFVGSTFALASGDTVRLSGFYEAAS